MVVPKALSKVDLDDVPTHIAVIMDGNGRWATDRGLPRTEGHRAGEEALLETIEGCLDCGVSWLTVYAFSTENWRRPKEEVRFLLNFNRNTLRNRRDELHERGVRIRFIGQRNWRVPRGVLREMEITEDLTSRNRHMTFTVAFNYGGRAEIVDAARKLIEDGVEPSKVSETAFARRLYAPDMPDPELMIRTSGEFRTSNYLPWQLAYSEMLFTEVLWPDFTRRHLWGAIVEYQRRERRFGGLS